MVSFLTHRKFVFILAWCNKKRIQTPMENMTVRQMDTNLRRFYAEARNKSRESYSKSSLLGFWHSFERYLNAPPLRRGLKLSSDPRFKRSNEMLNAQIVRLKRQGKENVTHKPAIESEDLMKLKTSPAIALSNPLALLRNVWFHVVLFFCRRGREGQRQLNKTSFKFEVDTSGRRFVTMVHDEATKNYPGGVSDIPSSEKLPRMYETPEENDGCKALKFYMAKLNPRCDAFFQYPRKNSKWKYADEAWFDARPIGTNKLDGMMKSISEEAKLSKNNVHQPQRQNHRNHIMVRCWCTELLHNGNFWSPQRTESFTLQHAALSITAPHLQ